MSDLFDPPEAAPTPNARAPQPKTAKPWKEPGYCAYGVLYKPLTIKELSLLTGHKPDALKPALTELVQAGCVKQIGPRWDRVL